MAKSRNTGGPTRPSYVIYAETKGFHRTPSIAAVQATMTRLTSEGAEVNARTVADALSAEGYDIDRTWVAKAITAHSLTGTVATTAIRELQLDKATRLSEVLDLRPLFDGTEAAKGLTVFMVQKIKERIERGDWPWPENPTEAIRMIEALAALDRTASDAAKTNIETALLTPGGLANGARDVTPPTRGRFASLLD
jgi:hypothetical protein